MNCLFLGMSSGWGIGGIKLTNLGSLLAILEEAVYT